MKRAHPKEVHEQNKKLLAKLEAAAVAPISTARISFSVVPHGWQCDVELLPKKGKLIKGTVCRDWADDHASAKRLITKLIEMGRTGRP